MNKLFSIIFAALVAALGLTPLAHGDPQGNPYLQKVSIQPAQTVSIFQTLWNERPRIVTYDTYGKPTKIVKASCPLEMLAREHLSIPDAIRQGLNKALTHVNDANLLPWDVYIVCSADGEV